MYAGHFASALALKASRPKTPTWALVTGCALLDLIFGLLAAVGLEGVLPDWQHAHLLNIPWSHSLLMAALLGAAFAASFYRHGSAIMATIFAAVLSHWLLDLLVHRPDLELWPGSATALGFYPLFGPVSGWAEAAIVAVATGLYAFRARTADDHGRRWIAMCTLMAAFLAVGIAGQ